MYEGKDYCLEADFFLRLIQKYGENVKKIGSLGAGTLNHEIHLGEQGFIIKGIDISPDMVALAKEKIQKEKIENIKIEYMDGTIKLISKSDASNIQVKNWEEEGSRSLED